MSSNIIKSHVAKTTHKLTVPDSEKMRPYTVLIQQFKRYIRRKLRDQDLEEVVNPLAWNDLERSILKQLNSQYCKLHKIPFITKYPKPPRGSSAIPSLDRSIGIKLQALTYLKKYFERQSNRTFALLHNDSAYPLPLHLFDSTPFDELIHKRRYTMDFHGTPISPDIPNDLLKEAEVLSKDLKIPRKVWMPHFQGFYREEMNTLQRRRSTGQCYYRH